MEGVFAMLTGRLGIVRVGVAVGGCVVVRWLRPFPCRAAQEGSVPDGSTPVGEVVIVA
jgi:hypothetical protein